MPWWFVDSARVRHQPGAGGAGRYGAELSVHRPLACRDCPTRPNGQQSAVPPRVAGDRTGGRDTRCDQWPSRNGRGDARPSGARRAAGAAAEVADRADRGVAALVEGIGHFATLRGKRVKSFDLEGFASLRDSFIGRGYRWPAWCFLPAPLVGAGLGEDLAVDVNPALISPATMLATLAAAWTPGRIAVRFDDDVAQALMDTPMEASIPTEVLEQRDDFLELQPVDLDVEILRVNVVAEPLQRIPGYPPTTSARPPRRRASSATATASSASARR